VVQFQHAAGAKDTNFAVVESFARQAQTLGVKVLVFPEMCLTGYWHARHLDRAGWEALSEPVPEGPSTRRLLSLSRESGMVIGAGSSSATGSGSSTPMSWPCRTGHGTATASSTPLRALTSRAATASPCSTRPWGVRIGVLICYDTNIVENVRATRFWAATSSGAAPDGRDRLKEPARDEACGPGPLAQPAREPEALRPEFQGDKGGAGSCAGCRPAHDNGLFLLFANGVGLDDDEVRTGNAMIIDCYGRIQAESDALGDDMVVADLDLTLCRSAQGGAGSGRAGRSSTARSPCHSATSCRRRRHGSRKSRREGTIRGNGAVRRMRTSLRLGRCAVR
jgi:predicted amidohydrolase